MATEETKTIDHLPILKSFYLISSKVTKPDELLPMMKSINYLLNNERFDVIDNLLKGIELDKCNPLFMVSLIRVLSSVSDNLNKYNDCLYEIKLRLLGLDVNLDEILRGM